MHVHCLHWLISTGLLFQSAFCQPYKSLTGEMAPKEASNSPWGLSEHVCPGLVAEYWPFVDACTCHSYSKLYYLCHLASLFKLLPPPTPPRAPLTYPLIYVGPILMNSMKKIIKTGKNQPLSTCQFSCTTTNR